ncbi:hypothetical protein GOP47_0030136 [Adiantum capillus-veneris]|nr:hypothetical protein GOP47_0030136 [Adiantum capillus-veneris]
MHSTSLLPLPTQTSSLTSALRLMWVFSLPLESRHLHPFFPPAQSATGNICCLFIQFILAITTIISFLQSLLLGLQFAGIEEN